MKAVRAVSIVLCFIFVVSFVLVSVIPALAVNNSTIYTAIGDSIAAGYGLPSYTADGCTPTEGYVKQFANEIGADKVNDKAITNSDTDDMIDMLKNNISYREAVSEATVITMSMGSNDILIPGQKMIFDNLGVTNINQIGAKFTGLSYTEKIGVIKGVCDYIKSPEQIEILNAALAEFKTNWVEIIDTIKTLNSDAVIIVNNYYNPYEPFDNVLFTAFGVDIAQTVQIYLTAMNEYISGHEYNNVKYYIADVTGVGYGKTNVSIENNEYDPHPNTEGHKYLFEKVSAVYTDIIEMENSQTSTAGNSEDTSAPPEVNTTTTAAEQGGNDPVGYTTTTAAEQGGNDPVGYTTTTAAEQGGNDPEGYTTTTAAEQGGNDPVGYTTTTAAEQGGNDPEGYTTTTTAKQDGNAPDNNATTTTIMSVEKDDVEDVKVGSLFGCKSSNGGMVIAVLSVLTICLAGFAVIVIKRK